MTKPRLALLLCLTVAAPAAAACPETTVENVRNSFRGAFSLCHNLSLQTSNYSPAAVRRLEKAAASFKGAEERFNALNVLGALGQAAKGVNQTFAAGHADNVLLFQLGPLRTFMAESAAAYLRCTLDDLIAAHPKEAARAEQFYAQALAANQQENFARAIKLFRKGFKKVRRFLGV